MYPFLSLLFTFARNRIGRFLTNTYYCWILKHIQTSISSLCSSFLHKRSTGSGSSTVNNSVCLLVLSVASDLFLEFPKFDVSFSEYVSCICISFNLSVIVKLMFSFSWNTIVVSLIAIRELSQVLASKSIAISLLNTFTLCWGKNCASGFVSICNLLEICCIVCCSRNDCKVNDECQHSLETIPQIGWFLFCLQKCVKFLLSFKSKICLANWNLFAKCSNAKYMARISWC